MTKIPNKSESSAPLGRAAAGPAPLVSRCLSPLILIAVSWIPYFVLAPEVLFARRALWLLVIAPASFIVIWIYEHSFGQSAREHSRRQAIFGFLWALGACVLTNLYLWIGYNLSLVNFSYGPNGFPPLDLFRLARIIVSIFAVRYFAEELFLRGFVFRRSCRKFGWLKAVMIMTVVQNAVYLPYWISEHGSEQNLGNIRAILLENWVGLESAAVFAISGSVFAGTCFHAFFDFARSVVLADAESSFQPLYMYSSSSPGFYWLMIVNHFALCMALWICAARIGSKKIVHGHA